VNANVRLDLDQTRYERQLCNSVKIVAL